MPKTKIQPKDELDRFYTKSDISKSCVESLRLSDYDCVIEPSAGEGSFIQWLDHDNVLAFDIDDGVMNPDVIKQDWLEYEIPSHYEDVLVIGNPPFGQRNHLSKRFISHSIGFANVTTVAFILPDVFNKFTTQKVFNPNWNLKRIISLDKVAFDLNGASYGIKCSFFEWTRKDCIDLRASNELLPNSEFKFVSKDDADVFVFGAAPTKTLHPSQVSETNRGYYLKCLNGLTPEDLCVKLKHTSFTGYSSVSGGVSWLTKSEFNNTYIMRHSI